MCVDLGRLPMNEPLGGGHRAPSHVAAGPRTDVPHVQYIVSCGVFVTSTILVFHQISADATQHTPG